MKRKNVLGFAFGLAALFCLWLLLSFQIGSNLVPGPNLVFPQIASLLVSSDFWYACGLTWLRTLIGFTAAFCLGIVLGNWMGAKSGVGDFFLFIPLILLQAAPPIIWVIPLVLYLGTDSLVPMVLVFFVVLPLVTLNVRSARMSIPAAPWDVFKVYAPRRSLIFKELLIPALNPALKSSFILSFLLGLKSAVVGEWFGSHTGLGHRINELYQLFDMTNFYALALLFLSFSALTGFLGQKLAQVLFPYYRPHKPSLGRVKKAQDPSQTLQPAALRMQGVAFTWTGGRTLFQGLNLEVEPGELLILTGKSGIGKTTLARLSLKLLKPSQGSILGPHRPAVLFQEDGLLEHRDVWGNACLALWNQERSEEGVAQVLQQVGLGGEEKKFPHELSGGMRKRLALARAVLQNADFWVLDEPFQNLDEEARKNLWMLTFSLLEKHHLGALVITHYPQELEGLVTDYAFKIKKMNL